MGTRRITGRTLGMITVATALVATVGPVAAAGSSAPSGRATVLPTAATPVTASTTLSGLDLPWDMAFISGSEFLFTERDRKTVSWGTTAGAKRVVAMSPTIWSSGETGLMAIAAAPDFASSREFYTCNGYRSGGTTDVRVIRWRLNAAKTSAVSVKYVATGFPVSSGRHGGCALEFSGGALYIGTGDAAIGTNAQDLGSLGGKVLRVDPTTGNGWKWNPFITSGNAKKRLIYTYGHRNVQGLSRRPSGGIWSIEQGSSRDDEVNLATNGGNYGWNPVPGYNESVPMTDHGLPGPQVSAKWRSGASTIATSGGAWIYGSQWGDRSNNVLAVGALKDQSLRFLRFDRSGKLTAQSTHLKSKYGRIRGVTRAPNGTLYVWTGNGGGGDRILRVTPG